MNKDTNKRHIIVNNKKGFTQTAYIGSLVTILVLHALHMIIFWFYLLIKITNEELPRCNLALLPGCVCTWPSWEGRSNHHHWSGKIFFTAQYLPEESVLPPICAPRVAPDPELLPGLLIYLGLKTCVGRLYF